MDECKPLAPGKPAAGGNGKVNHANKLGNNDAAAMASEAR